MKASLVCLSEPLAAVGVSIGVGVVSVSKCCRVVFDVVARQRCVGVAALCQRCNVAAGLARRMGIMVLPRRVGVVLPHCVDVVARQRCVGVAALCQRRNVAAGLAQRMGIVTSPEGLRVAWCRNVAGGLARHMGVVTSPEGLRSVWVS
ncbi:hypothetical protein EDB86DRAFT_2833645 [Lactarius hatsudake]|nr:hypothetical protein EDB86DRAFT_2833645 [Lactarius hatsudake]